MHWTEKYKEKNLLLNKRVKQWGYEQIDVWVGEFSKILPGNSVRLRHYINESLFKT